MEATGIERLIEYVKTFLILLILQTTKFYVLLCMCFYIWMEISIWLISPQYV